MTQAHALPDPLDRDAWRAWADNELRPMDLSTNLLHQAVEAGQRKQDAASPLAPVITPGTDRWSATVVTLRELTRWDRDESGGLPRTVHPSGRFYILALTGADGVGTFDHRPTPKNGLGKTLQRIIDDVPTTAPLFSRDGSLSETDDVVEPELWLLLSCYHDELIHLELSRPSHRVGERITAYAKRIQIPPLPYTRPDASVIITPDDGPVTGPDFPVEPI